MFNQAHDFTFNGSVVVNMVSPQGDHAGPSSSSAMRELKAHISPAALHNSDERNDPPRCHPKTRVAIQDSVMSWITSDKEDAKPVLLLKGPAGTGKTAILQTMAEQCASKGLLGANKGSLDPEKGSLGASFFFSYRAPETRNKKYLVPTLAYQLAQNVGGLKPSILAAIERDPCIFDKNMQSQMDALILQPLSEAANQGELDPSPKVIIIDGLDECSPVDISGSCSTARDRIAREEEQRKVLEVIVAAARHPSFPFRVLLGSRPERAIRNFFANLPTQDYWTITLDETYNPDADIELLVRCSLSEITQTFGIECDGSWVTEDVIRTLVRNASGQFIYIATVLRFIKEAQGCTHQDRLQLILGGGQRQKRIEDTPFRHLDYCYSRVLESSPDPTLSVVWLRAVHFLSSTKKVPASFVDRFLESQSGDVERLLGNLHSILSVPQDKDRFHYRFYHLSFPEFLNDPGRAKEFYVDDQVWVNFFILRYLTFYQPKPRSTIEEKHLITCASIQIPDLKCISPTPEVITAMLEYDIQAWFEHVVQHGDGHCCSWNLGTLYDWVHCHIQCSKYLIRSAIGIILAGACAENGTRPSRVQVQLGFLLVAAVFFLLLSPPPSPPHFDPIFPGAFQNFAAHDGDTEQPNPTTMDSSRTPSPAELESPNAVYSISDQVISQELDFIEEIGNGNWGSVWLVKPKRSRPFSEHVALRDAGRKFAVKLVHRKKTAANASRIKSLWNEMKIVRAFKDDPHPSIISFHSFVMTPSYAMITMTYLPTLIPVEVEESKAREWFHFLLSGVDFLHRRGVVHNDIKPANILLSHKNIPVLVDFGFAELKDPEEETSFHSNLTYGTPEYLSPERARGITHDTRKSDVWSLGVTFFEILCGRTPFEEYDGNALETKEDVERYWSRTLRGKWIGKWSFSDRMEKLLLRMMSPNADLRCTASGALNDAYWKSKRDSQVHRRSASYTSLAFEKDLDKLLNMTPPSKAIENPVSPPGLGHELSDASIRHSLVKSRSQPKVNTMTATKPQPRKKAHPVMDLSPIKASPPTTPHRSASAKENHVMSNSSLNPHKDASKTRRAFGAVLSPDNSLSQSAATAAAISRIPVKKLDEMTSKRRSGVFAELRKSHSSLANQNHHQHQQADGKSTGTKKTSSNVKDRVMEWEREKQRLREMERLEELERERDEHFERERENERAQEKEKEKKEEQQQEDQLRKQVAEENERPMLFKKESRPHDGVEGRNTRIPVKKATGQRDKESVAVDFDKENAPTKERPSRPASPPTLPLPPVMSPLSRMLNTLPAPTPNNTPAQPAGPPVPPKQSKQNIFRHTIKSSIDKTLQFYKQSSIGRAAAASGSTPTRGISFEIAREAEQNERMMSRGWKDSQKAAESSVPATPMTSPPATSPLSPLAPIKNAAVTEQVAAETQADRMAIWLKNVERVVEEAQVAFEMPSHSRDYKLPPLPVPPTARAQRSSRLPRRILAASQIFDESGAPSPIDSSFASNMPPPSSYSGHQFSNKDSSSAGHEQPASNVVSPTDSQFVIPEIFTPSRQRRATVSTRSPLEPIACPLFGESKVMPLPEPSSNAVSPKGSRQYGSLAQLRIMPLSMQDALDAEPSPRLAEVVDRSLFVKQPYTSRDDLLDNAGLGRDMSYEELQSSICHVEPYPLRPRPSQDQQPYLDTPDRQRLETVYDRFLMTSGVKRHGKGYQSETVPPVANTVGPSSSRKENSHRAFYTARKPMPPPVSSDDIERRAVSVDELGLMTTTAAPQAQDAELGGSTLLSKDEGHSTVALVRRAFKAMVPNGRRLSRAY